MEGGALRQRPDAHRKRIIVKKSQLALLNDQERLFVQQTFPDALAQLHEDEVVDLHSRIRRARNKYVGKYRRQAAKRVSKQGGWEGRPDPRTPARRPRPRFSRKPCPT